MVTGKSLVLIRYRIITFPWLTAFEMCRAIEPVMHRKHPFAAFGLSKVSLCQTMIHTEEEDRPRLFIDSFILWNGHC